jgi:hypothetical protein
MKQQDCSDCGLAVFDKPVCPKCEKPVPPVPREGRYWEDYGGKEAQARHKALGLCNCVRCLRCWGVIDGPVPGACENAPACC